MPEFEIGIVAGSPFVQVREQVTQVLHAIVGGLHGIVAEVLLEGARIDPGQELLLPVTINGIARTVRYPAVQHGGLLLGRRGFGNRTVEPVDGVVIVFTQFGRRQPHAPLLVAGLRHEVVAGIVHDRVGRPVAGGERGRAQRVDGDARRAGHVVHQR